jgi:hypothetical protein
MLPELAAYLETLPSGLASYPKALVKGSVVRDFILGSNLVAHIRAGQLATDLEALVRDPPPPGAWIPETHFVAITVAINALRFKEDGGVPAFERWALDVNRRLLRSALYRVLFLVVSTERVFIGTERRWSAFHRGSDLHVVSRAGREAVLELTFPPKLFPDLLLRAFGCALQAAGEAAGSPRVDFTVGPETNGGARYAITWT